MKTSRRTTHIYRFLPEPYKGKWRVLDLQTGRWWFAENEAQAEQKALEKSNEALRRLWGSEVAA